MFRTSFLAGFALVASTAVASAQMIVEDPFARAASVMAQSGAIFLQVSNPTDIDDTLIGVRSDAAERVELHTHLEDANGVMRMIEVEDGFAIPAGGSHALQRGGDHIMLLGLTAPLEQGDTFELTLIFETAEPLTITVPVDNERVPGHGQMNHGDMQMGDG